jgi:O-antigen/teichoic acid export membrane protein
MNQIVNLASHVAKSQFFRSIATLASGKLLSMFILLFTTPIISRLFFPEDVGVVSLLSTIVMFIAGIAALNYNRAAIIAKNNDDYRALISFSVILLSGVSLALLLIIVIVHMAGHPVPFEKKLGALIWLVPVMTWFAGIALLLKSSLTRTNEFTCIMRSDVGEAVIQAGSRILLGYSYGSSVWALVTSRITGLLGRLWLMRSANVSIRGLLSTRESGSRLRSAAVEYRDFPVYGFPSTFAMSLSAKLPYFVFGMLFSPEVLGFFAMSDRLVKMPLSAVGRAIQRVYLRRASMIRNNGKSLLRPFFLATALLLASGVLPFGLLWAYGGIVIDFVLGDRWHGAGQYVVVLAPWFFSVWVSIAAQPTMTVMRAQPVWFRLQLFMLLVRVSAFGYAYNIGADPLYMMGIFAYANVAVTMLVLLVCLYLTARHNAAGAD